MSGHNSQYIDDTRYLKFVSFQGNNVHVTGLHVFVLIFWYMV